MHASPPSRLRAAVARSAAVVHLAAALHMAAVLFLAAALAPALLPTAAAARRPATPFEVRVRLLAVAGPAARVVPFDHLFAKQERVRFEVEPGRPCYVRLVHAGPGGMRMRLWPEEGVLPLAPGRLTSLPAGGVLRFDRSGDQPVELVFSLVASPKRPDRQARRIPLLPGAAARGGGLRFAGTLDGDQTAVVALTLRRP